MIIDYTRDIQIELEEFFEIVLNARGWGFYPEGRHLALRNIENVYPKDRGGFWIYIIDKRIIGTAAIRKIGITDRKCGVCELKSMYVLPEFQGMGYGKKLMNYAIDEATKIGYKYIRLDTTKDSKKAINMYKTAGFYEIERYNDNDMAEVFMELKIPE